MRRKPASDMPTASGGAEDGIRAWTGIERPLKLSIKKRLLIDCYRSGSCPTGRKFAPIPLAENYFWFHQFAAASSHCNQHHWVNYHPCASFQSQHAEITGLPSRI